MRQIFALARARGRRQCNEDAPGSHIKDVHRLLSPPVPWAVLLLVSWIRIHVSANMTPHLWSLTAAAEHWSCYGFIVRWVVRNFRSQCTLEMFGSLPYTQLFNLPLVLHSRTLCPLLGRIRNDRRTAKMERPVRTERPAKMERTDMEPAKELS